MLDPLPIFAARQHLFQLAKQGYRTSVTDTRYRITRAGQVVAQGEADGRADALIKASSAVLAAPVAAQATVC